VPRHLLAQPYDSALFAPKWSKRASSIGKRASQSVPLESLRPRQLVTPVRTLETSVHRSRAVFEWPWRADRRCADPDDEARHPVLDRLVTTARSTRDLRHTRRGRLDEDDAEALLFESEPSTATVHHHEIARGDPVAQLTSSGTRPRKVTGASSRFASFFKRFSSRPVPPITTWSFGAHWDLSFAAARINVSMPLRGTRREYELTRKASHAAPAMCAPRREAAGASGVNFMVSTPGGTWMIGGVYSAAMLRTIGLGVGPGTDRDRGVLQYVAKRRRHDRDATGRGHLGAVHDTP
jgi:hypothetical protein